MGKSELLIKLDRELKRDIEDELQVVYILSRIRKVLELEDKKKAFKNLNFYCNWALHSELTKIQDMSDWIEEFIQGKDASNFYSFKYLTDDLEKFLKEYRLPTKIIDKPKNYMRFLNLLVAVYSDTPLTIRLDAKYQIVIRKPDKPFLGMPFSIEHYIMKT